MLAVIAIPMVMFLAFAGDYSRVLASDRDLREIVNAASIAAAAYRVDRISAMSAALDGGGHRLDEDVSPVRGESGDGRAFRSSN